jgi:hypothetical protein
MNQLLALVTPVVMHRGDVDIRSAKRRAWQNKVAKEFNTTDILLEFCLLQGEDRQSTSAQSQFLDACRSRNRGELDAMQLRACR